MIESNPIKKEAARETAANQKKTDSTELTESYLLPASLDTKVRVRPDRPDQKPKKTRLKYGFLMTPI
jgi:hypothetical protein